MNKIKKAKELKTIKVLGQIKKASMIIKSNIFLYAYKNNTSYVLKHGGKEAFI